MPTINITFPDGHVIEMSYNTTVPQQIRRAMGGSEVFVYDIELHENVYRAIPANRRTEEYHRAVGRLYGNYMAGVDPISPDATVQTVRLTNGLAEYTQPARRSVDRQQMLDELARAQQERARQQRANAYIDCLREYYRAVGVEPRNPAEEVELDIQERTAAAIIDREAVRYAAELRERAAAQEAIQYAFGGVDHNVFTGFLGDSISTDTPYTGDGIVANAGRTASPWVYTTGFSYQDLDALFKERENKIGMFIPAAEKIEEPKFSQEELDDCPFL